MARFQTTNWSQVLAARDEPSSAGREALEALCERYWQPLCSCIRASGYDAESARDLTQEFFTQLLYRDFLKQVTPEAGRFRSFLLASLRNFLSHQREREKAQKRGGGRAPVSLDGRRSGDRTAEEPADRRTPQEVFEHRWALTVVGHATGRLRRELEARGEGDRFDRLRQFLTGETPHASYREVGSELGLTEDSVKAAVHRLRRRLGRLLREEIAATVTRPEEIDDEVRHLLRTLGRAPQDPP